jgi:hypothetical protein
MNGKATTIHGVNMKYSIEFSSEELDILYDAMGEYSYFIEGKTDIEDIAKERVISDIMDKIREVTVKEITE